MMWVSLVHTRPRQTHLQARVLSAAHIGMPKQAMSWCHSVGMRLPHPSVNSCRRHRHRLPAHPCFPRLLLPRRRLHLVRHSRPRPRRRRLPCPPRRRLRPHYARHRLRFLPQMPQQGLIHPIPLRASPRAPRPLRRRRPGPFRPLHHPPWQVGREAGKVIELSSCLCSVFCLMTSDLPTHLPYRMGTLSSDQRHPLRAAATVASGGRHHSDRRLGGTGGAASEGRARRAAAAAAGGVGLACCSRCVRQLPVLKLVLVHRQCWSTACRPGGWALGGGRWGSMARWADSAACPCCDYQ